MPQLQLPIFNEGVHIITPNLGYQRDGDEVVYLHGVMPVFLHHCDDLASFKMIISQFYINGNAKQSQLVRAFGIKPLSLKRWVTKYRAHGPKAFFETRRKRVTAQKKSP
jgi:Helix-turn-helix domain